jgi:hypothetical protein
VIFIDFFSGDGRSNGLDCSERSNLISKKHVSLVLFATVWIIKSCRRERIKALLTNHELKECTISEQPQTPALVRTTTRVISEVLSQGNEFLSVPLISFNKSDLGINVTSFYI